MKGLRFLLEALAKLRTERGRDARRDRPAQGRAAHRRDASQRLGLADVVEFVSGVSDERIVELTPRPSWRWCRRSTRGSRCRPSRPWPAASRSWPPPAAPSPRWSAPTARRPSSCRPGDAEALAARIARRARRPRRGAPVSAAAGRQRVIERWSWRHTAERTVEQYRALLAAQPGSRDADRHVLTVDYDRLGLRRRRPRARPRLRRRPPRLRGRPAAAPTSSPRTSTRPSSRTSPGCSRPWTTPARLAAAGGSGAAVNGDARRPAVPRRHLRPHHRLRGARAHPRRRRRHRRAARVLRPGGTLAVTVPAWLPEQICWALSDEYHAPSSRAATSASTPSPRLRHRLRNAGLRPGAAHHAHALHSPVLVAAVRGRPRPTTSTRWCGPTTGCWCGTSCGPVLDPARRAARSTRPRQEPRRLRPQAGGVRPASGDGRAA